MKLYLDYPTFNQICLAMAQKISLWNPDQLVAVSRGGLSAAHIISKHLNLKCGVYFPYEEKLTLSHSFKPVKKIVFIEDLIAQGRTITNIKNIMETIPEYKNYEWKIAPVLIDDSFDKSLWKNEIVTYGIISPHWIVMPYEDFEMTKENDRGLFRDGTDKYDR